MPFNFKEYEDECKGMSDARLRSQKHHYTRAAASGVVGSTAGFGFAFFTFGLSLIGSAVSSAAALNAGFKLDIIADEMRSRTGSWDRTRKRDLAGGLLLGTCTTALGLGVGHGAGSVIGEGALAHSAGVYAERYADYAVDEGDKCRGRR